MSPKAASGGRPGVEDLLEALVGERVLRELQVTALRCPNVHGERSTECIKTLIIASLMGKIASAAVGCLKVVAFNWNDQPPVRLNSVQCFMIL